MNKLISILLVVLFILTFMGNAYAQSATSEAKFINVSYDLPYPGILPDNPLYFLKALRDNMISFLITDPIKKSEYDLLMADKRLASAKSLIEKKNYGLGITTLSKSGNYFDQAIQLAASAKTQGLGANNIINKLYTASLKHQQTIYLMSQLTKGEVKYNLELLQVRAKNFQDTVDVIKSQ